MIVKAKARYVRIGPRKLRNIVDLIKGKKVEEAFGILRNLKK
ncbi:MAG: 50S ribosomal protein L22, partial [Candidatus Omnitrophica bacterium]|nr:50S ribosomal protein L22 [Candidatus Omnitrophota bacterium]